MNSYGNRYRFTLFGESHAPEIGVRIEGLQSGIPIDQAALQAFLDRRAPGRFEWSTSRKEADQVIFTEGLDGDSRTDGGPVTAVIRNTDARPADYAAFGSIPRPGHADYPAWAKTGSLPAGGGKWSGRLTAPFCIAGGIALQQLEKEGICVRARIGSIGGIQDTRGGFLSSDASPSLLSSDPLMNKRFTEKILAAKAAGDSVGGVVECQVMGLPVGLGDHPFLGLENRIAAAVFGIPAVKGIEFGDGFALSALHGSEANDAFRMEDGRVVTSSNHCGGILGGMSDGMPLVFRAAFKPTPTIAKAQESVDLASGENVLLEGRGRHDPCVVPRAVPVVEAAAACALYDALLSEKEDAPSLEALRRRIDACDRKLLAAFEERMKISAEIATLKGQSGKPVRDPAREEALLKKVVSALPSELASYGTALYQTIFSLSRNYQEKLLKQDAEAKA